jgi:hypothetical protein
VPIRRRAQQDPLADRAALLTGLLAAVPVLADEGMWTYDNPPLAQLKDARGILEALRKVYGADELVRELTAP